MLKIFQPDIGKYHTFSKHVLLWIKSGSGLVEVDFKSYSELEDRLIFLSPHQPVKFVFGQFEVALLEFPNAFVSKSRDYRVLFKHLIALGYIEFSEKKQLILNTLFQDNPQKILDLSTHQWFWQNPFNANKDEYTLIFDLKEVIDRHFDKNWNVDQFVSAMDHEHYALHRLIKNRLGLTIKSLAQRKVLIESQKDIALTDKPIQEVAYDMGFRDPAYFNRFFKKNTHLTPTEFRLRFGDPLTDNFLEDLLSLIRRHHRDHRSPSFYADKTHMSIKTLSRKVREKLNISVGELIRKEVINSARGLLDDLSVKETAYELGFEEAHHFSAFFKKYTSLSPSEYQSKKYKK